MNILPIANLLSKDGIAKTNIMQDSVADHVPWQDSSDLTTNQFMPRQ